MLQIKVYNSLGDAQTLDLQPNVSLNMDRVCPNFDLDLQSADFSMPLSIPFTNRNRLILGFAEHESTQIETIPEYWRCDVYSEQVPILQDAKLKLLSTAGNRIFNAGEYSFNITGTKGLFGSLIKNKKMNELQLGGKIIFPDYEDSRQFATAVHSGNYPSVYERLGFAPVYFADFFDTTRSDYSNEFLAFDTVNRVVTNTSFPNGWKFGREDDTTPGAVIASGAAGYADYRTIPFFRMKYVLQQLFLEHGYAVGGTFFDLEDIDRLLLFNNFAIERYDDPFKIDTNREINPINHMPDMLISDFLIELVRFFNLKLEFKLNVVFINFRKIPTTSIDYTNKLGPAYSNVEMHPSFYGGNLLQCEFDSNDSYHSDKIKEIKNLTIIATAPTFTDLAAMSFPFTLDATHYALVIAENYYYQYNPTVSKWEAYSENLNDYEEGKKEVQYITKFSPLCTHYALDAVTSLIVNKGICGVRMKGSYFNFKKEKVSHEFGLRLFYEGKETTVSLTDYPYSHSHNYDVNAKKIAKLSLSWLAEDGLFNMCWKEWLSILRTSFTEKHTLHLDDVELAHIYFTERFQLNNKQYLLQKVNFSIPFYNGVEIDCVKI